MRDWKKVKLGDLLTESKIVSEKPDANKRLTVRLHIEGIEKRPYSKDKKGATKYYVRSKGQFIYGRQNLHKGAFGIVPEELDGFESSADIPAFDVDKSCLPEWIFYFFKKGDFYLKLESLAKGIGSKRIQTKQIYNLDILLPPKDEQKKILDEIHEIENKHSLLLQELLQQDEYIKKLRQSILMDAVCGRLTADWRKENTNIGSASELLINSRKEIEKDIRSEVSLSKIKQDEVPYDIPKNWLWVRFGDYIKCERGRFSARPRNDPRYYNGKYPFIQIGNIPNEGGRIQSHNQTLNEEGLKVSKLFPKNTIVIAIVGATIGNSGIIDYDMCFPDSIIGIKPSKSFNTQFIYLFLQHRKMELRHEAYSGGGQPNIKLTTINELLLPLPPLNEQITIAQQVETLLNHANKLQRKVNKNKSDAGLLINSVLVDILGEENKIEKKINETSSKISLKRDKIFDSKTTNMELVELLRLHGRLHAEDLWKMSEFPKDIDAFYAELKKQIEVIRTIKESQKGYLELV